jgi:trans-aconitate methyltransferase
MTLAALHDEGRRQCSVQTRDLTAAEPIPGAPFGLVYARLLLFHLPRRVEVLARLWDAVAPGGYLLVQESAFRSVLPTALAHGVTTEADAAATLASIDRDAARFPDRPVLWPLLIGAWKRKEQA